MRRFFSFSFSFSVFCFLSYLKVVVFVLILIVVVLLACTFFSLLFSSSSSSFLLSFHRYESNVVDVDDEEGEETGESIQYAGALVTSIGNRILFDECVWCTSAAPQPWLRDTGLELDEHGFISVDDDLRSSNTTNVFATGDVATMKNYWRPKAGVFAVRQGPPLALNLRHALLGEELGEFCVWCWGIFYFY